MPSYVGIERCPWPLVWTLAFTLAIATSSFAEDRILFLKNGREIRVQQFWEEGDQIIYVKNSSTFGFPKKLLDRIGRVETVRQPAQTQGSSSASERSSTPPRNFRNKIATDTIENARQAVRDGDPPLATAHYKRAIKKAPDSVVARVELAELYMARDDLFSAQSQLEQAKRINPRDSTVRELLGDVYYQRGRISLAIREWQKSMEWDPGPSVVYKLKKALRENDEDISFTEVERPNFVVRYDGRVNEAIGRKIATTMDEEYYELTREMSFSPRSPLQLTLYTEREFREQTHAPSWASAINDGEIRIPIEGLTEVTPRVRQLLRHELTHSFVNARTKGNCPTWFHEGLAQMRDRSPKSTHLERLRNAHAEAALLPLWSLEGPLLSYTKEQALLAYAESLSAVEYVVARRGASAIPKILDLLSRKETMNDALKKVVGLDYQQFQTAWENDLNRYRPSEP